jgi:hypothetical protein
LKSLKNFGQSLPLPRVKLGKLTLPSGYLKSQNKACDPLSSLYSTLAMNATPSAPIPTVQNLIALLDWRNEPNLSPYQRHAWHALLAMPEGEVLPALREYRENILATDKQWMPYDYARAFERCKATNKTNL